MLKWNLGWVMGKNELMENSEKRKYASPSPVFWDFYTILQWPMLIFCFHQHLENWKPKLWRVGNLTIFHMIDIDEMRDIFQFFHNGRHWYSVSVNTQKSGDPNFGGISNLNFFCTININEMRAIFQFFHNGQHWYSVSINTQKTRDPNFGGLVIWNFSVWSILMKWEPFFIMADTDIPFLSTLGKLET